MLLSSSDNQTTTISKRIEALSRTRTADLQVIKFNISNDLDTLINEVNTQVSHKLKNNKQQMLAAVTDLNASLRQKLTESLFCTFSSLIDSLRGSDFESLDISNWITTSLNLFEDQLGGLSLNQGRVLEIINDLVSTWNDRIENLKTTSLSKYSNLAEPSVSSLHPSLRQQAEDSFRGREPPPSRDSRNISESSKAGSRDASKSRASEGRGPSPSGSERKPSLFSKMSDLFKKEKEQKDKADGPTNINLGDDKNFTYDPIKKRYIFHDSNQEEESEDEGAPPPMGSQPVKKIEESEKEKGPTHSLVKPPENRSLAKKKAQSKQPTEAKKPAFIPGRFMPSTAQESENVRGSSEIREAEDTNFTGLGVLEEIKKRIDEIFEHTLERGIVIHGVDRIRKDLQILDGVNMPQVNEEITREAKLFVLENELESTQVSILRESYTRKALESELSSLRESYQQTFNKEYDLLDTLKDLENELNVYKDLYEAKSQFQNVINAGPAHQNGLDNYWKGLKEGSTDKKKLMEIGNELKKNELQLQEVKSNLKTTQNRHDQVIQYLQKENNVSNQLRGLLEDSFKAQRDQDKLIVSLKEENLNVMTQYKELYSLLILLQNDKDSLSNNLVEKEERVVELERQLQEAQDKTKEHEVEKNRKGTELNNYWTKIEGLTAENEELRRKLREESTEKKQLIEQLQEEESNKNQLEVKLQEEEGYRRNAEDRLRDEEEYRRAAQEEVEEYSRRIETLNEEKEDFERRLEQSLDNERRTQRQLEMYEKDLRTALEEKEQAEREIRKEREKLFEELMESQSLNQTSNQEKELSNKFVEEVSTVNLQLEERIQILNGEVNKLYSEKQKSMEIVLEFIRSLKENVNDQEFNSLEDYIIELLESNSELTERYFRAMGTLSQVKDYIVRKLGEEQNRQNYNVDDLTTRLNNAETEKVYIEEQQRLIEEEARRLRETVDISREQIKELEQRNRELAEEDERLKAENDEYMRRNLDLENYLHQKEFEVGENVKALNETQFAQVSAIEELERQLGQLSQLKEEQARLENELEAEKTRNSQTYELEGQVNELKQENQELQQQLEEGFEQYTFLQGKLKDIIEQLKQAKEENSQIIKENGDLGQEIDNLRSQLESLTSETNTIQQQSASVEAERNELINELQNLNIRIETLSAELQARDEQIQELNSRISSQEIRQTADNDANQFNEKLDEMAKIIEDKDKALQEAQVLREEIVSNIRTLEEEKENALASLQALQTEKDNALTTLNALQSDHETLLSKLELIEAERHGLIDRLKEEEGKSYSLNNILEEAKESKVNVEEFQKSMEEKIGVFENVIRDLEEEKTKLQGEKEEIINERDELRREIRNLEGALAERQNDKSGNTVDAEELWTEIQREYEGSRVMEYLQTMKSKIGVEKGLSAGKLVNVLLREFEDAMAEFSREMEEKETTLLGLTRSLDEMNEQYQKLQNNMTMLEGEHSEKEDYSSIRELYEKKSKRVEELLKEIDTKNTQIEQLKKTLDDQAHVFEEKNKETQGKGNQEEAHDILSLKDEVKQLKHNVETEKEKGQKVADEFEAYKKKFKNNNEERGAIQHSYTQIIKNLSIQLDEVKKKKGIPTATMVNKTTQTGTEEEVVVRKSAEEDQLKKGGFLSGMAKFFLTEAEVKKI